MVSLSVLTAIFQLVPECLHSGFYWSYGWRRWWWQLAL